MIEQEIDYESENDDCKNSNEEIISDNNIDIKELNTIRNNIENMTKYNQIEILRILNEDKDIFLNENKYGIHINLSGVKTSTIEKIQKFIRYVNDQEKTLGSIEKEKEDYKNKYFNK